MTDYPALIIQKDLASLYRQMGQAGLVVNVVHDTAELMTFMKNHYGVLTDKPIVLSDLARWPQAQAKILKFIEESLSPIICIASEDNIQRVLLSRFRTIKKTPHIVKNEKDRPSLLRDKLKEEGSMLQMEDVIRYAPSTYPVLEVLQRSRMVAKDRIIQLVFS